MELKNFHFHAGRDEGYTPRRQNNVLRRHRLAGAHVQDVGLLVDAELGDEVDA